MTKPVWYLVLIVVFGLIPGWIVFKTESVMSAYSIAPSEPFAAAVVPEGYETLTSISASGGKLYEFYLSEQRTKFSLLVSPVVADRAPLPATPQEVLNTLIARQHARFQDQPSLAHFTQAYLGSTFDPQRAYETGDLGAAVPALKFVTNKGANYGLAAWRRDPAAGDPTQLGYEIALLAMKKNEPVSPVIFEKFVALLKPGLRYSGQMLPF